MEAYGDSPRRTYVAPRLRVYGTVGTITEIGLGKYVEKHPLKPGSKIRPK